ncbi:MAG: hypothetical protein AB7P99_04810 [Vicinamibacterales bacterium]
MIEPPRIEKAKCEACGWRGDNATGRGRCVQCGRLLFTDVEALGDPDTVVARVASGLRRWRLPIGDEIRLHHALDRVLRQILPAEEISPEHALSEASRIDYYLPRVQVGIEVKVKGSPSEVARQLDRYADEPGIGQLVLITGRVRLAAIGQAWRRPVPLTVIALVEGNL